jgi:hypothetical protein
MTEFIKGMSVTALENVELVEVVDVPYNIDPHEFNRKAREFMEKNSEIVEAAIKKAK